MRGGLKMGSPKFSHIVRFVNGEEEAYGTVAGEKVYSISDQGALRAFYIQDVRLLPPVKPSKIVCVGLNYIDHAKDVGKQIPDEPLLFLKAPSSLAGPGDKVVFPKLSKMLYSEGELVVVMGKKAKHVSETDALSYVLGYMCGNDISAKDIQRRDGLWDRGKSFDTFAPIGPAVCVGDVDPGNLAIELRVNGNICQKSNTRMMAFNVPRLIAYISSAMTLFPGDVIFTGTPGGSPEVMVGDVVEVDIENIGVLRNVVKDEDNL